MDLKLFDIKGEEKGAIKLPDLKVKASDKLIAQALRVLTANEKIHTANTKTRAEVRGGGKKPWKQKGTGRARAGSLRSPLFVGGGVTFGPRKDRNTSLKMPKAQLKTAFNAVFESYAKDKKIVAIESLNIDKTKHAQETILKISPDKKVTIVYTPEERDGLKGFRNLAQVSLRSQKSVNLLDIMRGQKIIFSKSSVDNMFNVKEAAAK